jgi:hypothetical protein
MDADFKGSSEHAAQHVHGVVPRSEPPAPQTVEQRVAKLEALITDDGATTVDELLAKARERRKRVED